MQNTSTRWLWLVPVLLMMTLLGARSLDDDLLFVDEYWSIYHAGGAPYGPVSPAEIWARAASLDPGGMGVLYYYLLAGWTALAGATPFAARAFSLLAGLLAAAGMYRLGRDLFSERVGLWAASALATSAFFIDYLHEARAYTMFALFAAFTTWAYWRLITAKSEPTTQQYGLLIVGMAGLAYTHYVGLLIDAAFGAYHVLFVGKSRRWWRILAAIAISGILYLPWLTATLNVVKEGLTVSREEHSMTAGQVIETLLHTASNGSVALLALVAGYALTERRRQAGLVWFVTLVTLALVLVVNARIPFMVHLRYLLGLWPLLALIVGIGLARLAHARVNALLLFAAWMGMGVVQNFRPAYIHDLYGQVYRAPRAGVYAALDIVRERAHPEDLALFHIAEPGREPFNYFVLGYLMHDLPVRYDQVERMNNSFAIDDNSYLLDVNTTLDDAPFVWTMVAPDMPTSQRTVVVDHVLRTRYARCETVLDRPDMRLTLYARAPSPGTLAPFFFATGTAGGDEIKLFPLRVEIRDGRLDTLLGWSLDASVPADTYSVAVHVENAQGELVASGDHGLPSGPVGCSASHIPLEGLSPGEYNLRVGVYPWQGGERLPGTAYESGEKGDRLVIWQFTIE